VQLVPEKDDLSHSDSSSTRRAAQDEEVRDHRADAQSINHRPAKKLPKTALLLCYCY